MGLCTDSIDTYAPLMVPNQPILPVKILNITGSNPIKDEDVYLVTAVYIPHQNLTILVNIKVYSTLSMT